MNQKEHWEKVYQSKSPNEVSWYKPHLDLSLDLILKSAISKDARIIDVGGGASTLVEDLLREGYNHLTVLDISSGALRQSKERLAEKAGRVTWIEADILKVDFPKKSFDLWHDRAVFHFLTSPDERRRYVKILNETLKPGGFSIIASFGLEGPSKCSGLEVMRYSPETLSQELGDAFALLKTIDERHQTPVGAFQNFVYCLFQKTPKSHSSKTLNRL